MRGSDWHYATRLLAPRSFYSAAGSDGGGLAAEGRSRRQVGVSVTTQGPTTSSEPVRHHFQPDVPLLAQVLRRHTNNASSLPLSTPSLPLRTQVFLATLH